MFANTALKFNLPSSWLNRQLKVAVIGLGGTGSAILTDLFQMHGVLTRLGGEGLNVHAYDGDTVSQSNVFRQSFWQHDVGLNKSDVLIDRLNQFGGTSWNSHPNYFGRMDALSNKFDLIITAVDKASVRAEIGNALAQNKINNGLWLDLGNNNHEANVYLGYQSPVQKDGECYLPTPYELFGNQWHEIAGKEVDIPSCSTEEAISKQTFGVNGMTSKSAVSMLLFPLLRFGSLEHHGLFIDLHKGTTTSMPIDPMQWAIYGYLAKPTLN